MGNGFLRLHCISSFISLIFNLSFHRRAADGRKKGGVQKLCQYVFRGRGVWPISDQRKGSCVILLTRGGRGSKISKIQLTSFVNGPQGLLSNSSPRSMSRDCHFSTTRHNLGLFPNLTMRPWRSNQKDTLVIAEIESREKLARTYWREIQIMVM